MQFKNLSNNPSQIPLLKEPLTYSELAKNLSDVEEFLLAYLHQSRDNFEKREQVFSSFMLEIEKIPFVLNDKYDSKTIPECANTSNISSCINIKGTKLC